MLTLQLGLGCEAGGLPGSLHGDERQDQAVDILPRLLLKLAAVEYPPAKGNDLGVNPVFHLLGCPQGMYSFQSGEGDF